MDNSTPDRIALILVRERRIGLGLAPASRWFDLYGLRMVRLEFPQVAYTPVAPAGALFAKPSLGA
jgi:hypothetical protein